MSNARNIANLPNGDDAPVYACRAWVNFNGTSTPAIRASGNVSSITDHGTGNQTVNFTTAMPDVNYSAVVTNDLSSNGTWYVVPYLHNFSTTSVGYRNFGHYSPNLNSADCVVISIAIFR